MTGWIGVTPTLPRGVWSITKFQAGQSAAIHGDKRDSRRHRDFLAGYDQVAGEGRS